MAHWGDVQAPPTVYTMQRLSRKRPVHNKIFMSVML